MKRHVYLPALLLTAALLVGCGHKAQPDADTDPNAQAALPPEGITALVLSDDTQVLRFRRDDDGVWFWQDDATFPLDQAGMPALLEAAAAMTASTPVQAGDDLSEYGLDDAKTSLSVTADGETLTFTRGDQAASGDWYLLCAEDASVRLVSDDAVKIFQLLDGSIYDMAVLPTMPAITEDTLRTAVIAGADGERFTIRSADGVRKVGARDVTEKTAPLVEELSRLSVTSCVDYAPAEGAAAAGVVTHLALSHPDVSFKLLRDGQEILHTPGDGQLLSAIYAALGRDFANSLLPVSGSGGAVRVEGFITKPLAGHGTRGRQLFFVNGRFVKSQLLAAAVEEAYRNRLLKGRFPGCVLHITLPVNEVDVNVHPAKTVVKFLSDKTVFDAVHYTVKDALDREGQPAPAEKKPFYQTMTAQEFRETTPAPQGVKLPFASGRPVGSAGADRPTVNRFAPAAPTVQTPRETVQPAAAPQGDVWQVRDAAPKAGKAFTVPSGREGVVYRITPPDAPEDSPAREQAAAETETVPAAVMPEKEPKNDTALSAPEAAPVQQELEMPETADSGETPWRIAGEVLKTYIICEDGEQNVWLIDKHAAHERIRFDALKADPVPPMAQQLLTPAAVTLTAEEYGAVLESLDVLAGYGFLCEDFGDGAVLVREIPDYIRAEDAAATLEELARKLLLQRADPAGARDELLHTMACKSAIKAGMTTDAAELAALVRQVQSGAVRYCPHGRPVAVQLRKYEVEKMFKRA